MLYQDATTAALMAIAEHRATGTHPKGRNAMEGCAGKNFLAREEATPASAEQGGEEGQHRAVAGSWSAAQQANPV
ncbi:hypothetical protein C5750_25875 [Phyllobacterium myrsinacearum]|uniref:Uncharacterized protein n=1 Tax=Phyllobacterium myrsinacearum TaxID=28101 RepID=A0A2S9J9R2_9HYPH|nr:hypothetical protein C5750_25875 [Phyllobacterium myrsinacearum]